MSNIWTAASEGNFARVQELIESGTGPNDKDENSYTPLHAAASWAHPEILRYLVSKGGSINIIDDDGETPLFVVESAEMARLVIELGGDASIKNEEGMTAEENMTEDFPHISLYLRSLSTSNPLPPPASNSLTTPAAASQPDLDTPTDALLSRVRTIMEASERGELSALELDDKLREVVEEAVNGQVEAGKEIGEMETDENGVALGVREREEEVGGAKRRKEEGGR